jgi:hypothetical protein
VATLVGAHAQDGGSGRTGRYTAVRLTGEGERDMWQGRTSHGRGARTDGRGHCVYGGGAARHSSVPGALAGATSRHDVKSISIGPA